MIRIIDAVNPDGSIALADVVLTTLGDVAAVEGSVATFLGGAVISLDSAAPIADRGEARDDLVENAGTVRARFVVDDGVVVAADFDSLLMFSAYAHFERATLHLGGLGATLPASPVPVYFNPTLQNGPQLTFPKSDNAAFFAMTDAFVLLPMRILQEIPFAMNTGVVAHEVSHRVFYYVGWNGGLFAAIAAHQYDAGAQQSFNRVKATDEGVADFFAAAITADPAFLAKSTPGSISDARDLSVTRVLDPRFIAGLEPQQDGQYDPYGPGAVVAAALWRLAQDHGVDTVEAAVIDGLRALSSQLVQSFTYQFGDLEREVARALPAADCAAACALFAERYLPVAGAFTGVCP
ncbi:MAG: hypothetical protein HY903_05290 [Deltaproteobacteria bacterium]|nr:hypothetical protein [Deltaproteobacteria bacterium]